jgi:hypothetical protein
LVWGPFVIKGADLLRVRARAIAATAKLEEVGGAETVVGSAGRTALKPVETAKDLITAPGQTIGDTFRGVGHIFGSAKAAIKATDPHKEGVRRLRALAARREIFVACAARAPSIEMGFFYRRQAALIAAYNKRVAPIRKFVRLGSAPMLKTGKGIVGILPVDYLIWTPPLEQLVASPGGHGVGAPSEIWITGQASEMATMKLAELGWKVQSRGPARAVIEHQPTDEDLRGPDGVNLIPTRQFRASLKSRTRCRFP